MTSKQRMYAALSHEEPDRVPKGENAFDSVYFQHEVGRATLCYAGWAELEALWAGRRDEVVADYIDAIVAMTAKMEWDYVRAPAAPRRRSYDGFKRVAEHAFMDGTGMLFSFNPDSGNVICPEKYNVDITMDDVRDDPDYSVDECELDIARAVIERLGDSHFIIGRPPFGGTFPYHSTVGMEEYLVRMITEPELVHRLAEVECEKFIIFAEALMDAGCDAIMETDDYADNRGLIMGKERYEEFVLPYLTRICEAIHARGKLFIKHGDGVMWEALDSFVDTGVDGWHGIQPSIGMDVKLLKQRYGAKLCLFGGMNVETLIAGTPEDVEAEVRRAIEYGAPGGGYVLTSGNVLEPGVKPGNYNAATELWRRIGTYPIGAGR